MRNGRDGEKKKNGEKKRGGKKKKIRMKIVATTSLPAVDRPNTDRWNAARSRQFLRISPIPYGILIPAVLHGGGGIKTLF